MIDVYVNPFKRRDNTLREDCYNKARYLLDNFIDSKLILKHYKYGGADLKFEISHDYAEAMTRGFHPSTFTTFFGIPVVINYNEEKSVKLYINVMDRFL